MLDMAKIILVVDDDEGLRYLLKRTLTSEGFEVDSAKSGAECLAKMRADAAGIDLILLDVMMPDISGFDTATQIMKDKELVRTPIIFLTAKADPKSRISGLLRAEEYITKPFDKADLVKKVRETLAKFPKSK
jgi:DNA-binding response OmpR family regulator